MREGKPCVVWRRIARQWVLEVLQRRQAALTSLIAMAEPATCAGILLSVAVDTGGHAGDVSEFVHDFKARDLAMAAFTRDSFREMRTVVPVDPTWHDVNTNPGDFGAGTGKISQFLDCCRVFCDGDMALHTFRRARNGHAVPGIGVGMAFHAFQSQR